VKPYSLLQIWGSFKENTAHISQSGKNRDKAIELMHRANYK